MWIVRGVKTRRPDSPLDLFGRCHGIARWYAPTPINTSGKLTLLKKRDSVSAILGDIRYN